jgi:AcrR family transcriptional regulator
MAERLRQDDRRRQLIGIGLEILATKPIHALSVDEVAAQAGISRGLLFHYFDTKQDYYAAVVRAAGRRLLGAAQAGPDVAAERQLTAIVAAFVGFVERHREPFLAFLHGGAGGDPQIQAIYEEVRNVLTDRTLAAAGVAASPATRLAVRGWWSLVESLAVDHAGQPSARATTEAQVTTGAQVTTEALVSYAVDALPGLLAGLDRLASPA